MTVAELDGRLCGFAGAGPSRDDDLDRRSESCTRSTSTHTPGGQGHGGALHDAALSELIRAFAFAALWVLEGNAPARRFYRARGWNPDGAQRPFMGASSLRLRRLLSGEP